MHELVRISFAFIIFIISCQIGDASCKASKLNFSKQISIASLFENGGHVRIRNALQNSRTLLADWWRSGTESHLLILEVVGGEWQTRYLTDESLWGKGWIAVKLLTDNKIIAAVDHQVEGPGPEILILQSSDSGKSWKILGCVVKPHYTASLTNFTITPPLFSLTLELDVEVFSDGRTGGTYVSTSTDGGTTWSKPSIQPSMYTYPADELEDFQAYDKEELLKFLSLY